MTHFLRLLGISLILSAIACPAETVLKDLRCEYLSNPIGIDAARPRFSWIWDSPQRGERQTAYQILVASSRELLAKDQGDVWDSGKVNSDETTQIAYAGAPLVSRQRCFWKVRAWDQAGQPVAGSPVAGFEMGLLQSADWHAPWISAEGAPATNHLQPLSYLRKSFALNRDITRAELYATALGLYAGKPEVAGDLLRQDTFPSWLFSVKHGATTIWERWDGWTPEKGFEDPGMNSFNHYAYGAVAEWIYRYAAGIDTVAEDAGFHTVYLHPNFDARLGSLDLSYESSYGAIRSAWTSTGEEAAWKVTIPPNTSGRLSLSAIEAQAYTLDGEDLAHSSLQRVAPNQAEQRVYELPSGTYSFKVKLSQP